MIITYSECVLVAQGIQHAMSMRHIFIRGLSGSTLSHKRHDFIKKAVTYLLTYSMEQSPS